ncbi:hypothetical protein L596_017946 [Steinernema carpocapsae]|uniref:Uncharacterized protein n=1 Tax=Steinernema carpocapsae TaxID=34508 RepID=A0A4U5N3F0_STECR|nr:hypothetical protein L596_017946 [Steinernema carpocapsae]
MKRFLDFATFQTLFRLLIYSCRNVSHSAAFSLLGTYGSRNVSRLLQCFMSHFTFESMVQETFLNPYSRVPLLDLSSKLKFCCFYYEVDLLLILFADNSQIQLPTHPNPPLHRH